MEAGARRRRKIFRIQGTKMYFCKGNLTFQVPKSSKISACGGLPLHKIQNRISLFGGVFYFWGGFFTFWSFFYFLDIPPSGWRGTAKYKIKNPRPKEACGSSNRVPTKPPSILTYTVYLLATTGVCLLLHHHLHPT